MPKIPAPTNNVWLHRFTLLTATATLALLAAGGLVTSHGAGMAVPDWPTSYGYNMFALPFKFWKGGVFYEHSHRLVASGVGLLTTILAGWLCLKESRRWMRWLGVIAFCAVVLQGILGGLRVVWFKDQLGIFHATLAQLFFVLTCAIALFTSRWWEELRPAARHDVGDALERAGPATGASILHRLALATTVLVLGQLILGATMRHQHAGLAIPDFPLAYGKLWPAMDVDSVAHYNQRRVEITAANPITPFQIGLQMAHRLMAVLILVGAGAVAGLAWREAKKTEARPHHQERGIHKPLTGETDARLCSESKVLARLAAGWLGLILGQIGLGAWTIWADKAADVATAHVLVGALSLVTGTLWCIIAFRRSAPLPGTKPAPAPFGALRTNSFGVGPAVGASK